MKERWGSTNSGRREISHLLSQAERSPESLWAAATLQASSLAAFFCYPNFYCCAWCYMVWNAPLASWGHLLCLCPLPVCCPHLTYSLRGRQGWWLTEFGGKCLDAGHALISHSQDTGAFSALFYLQIQTTAPYGLPWRVLTPFQLDDVHEPSQFIVEYYDKEKGSSAWGYKSEQWIGKRGSLGVCRRSFSYARQPVHHCKAYLVK